jgi:GNAT superfamily N-acetyltransferase
MLMADLKISPVETDEEFQAFATFPWEVYREDPHWVPPIPSDHYKFLDKKHNPFFEHGDAQYFLAHRGDKLVGTIAGITNDLYNEFQEVNVGFFGFFEVLEDKEAASALLEAAENWVRSKGHASIIGPAQYSTNEELGLLIDGFDDSPRILMTYNPPRYREYIEAKDYAKAMDLWAYRAAPQSLQGNIPPKLIRVTRKVMERRNLKLRKLNMRRYDEDVDKLKRIYNSSWARNWGFVPMTNNEFDHLAAQMKQFIDPDLVVLVEYGEKDVIGFGLALPDMNEPLRMAYPRPDTSEIFTLMKLLWHWKARPKFNWLRVWALGVHPDYQGLGVDSLMYLDLTNTAIKKGFKWAEMSWILETNDMINRAIQMMGGEVYKTYRMFEKAL